MDIRITFSDGPIEAEIEASEEDEYGDVLNKLADFTDEYEMQGSVGSGPGEPDKSTVEESAEISETVPVDDSNPSIEDPENLILANIDASEADLHRVIRTGRVEDGDIEELPAILPSTDPLGDSETEQILNTSIIILSVLDEYHGVSRVKTSDLKDMVEESGLTRDNFNNVSRLESENIYLNRRGSGSSATTELRPPGKEDAYEQVQELIEAQQAEATDE